MSGTATLPRKLTPEDLAKISDPFSYMVSRFQRRPLDFVAEILGAAPDPWQYEALMALQRGHTRLSIRSGHGVGKALPVSERHPTPDGERRWGDLQPGDRLFGCDGEPTHIVGRFEQGVRPIYRVTFDDGISLRVDAEHLWTVRGRAQRRVDTQRAYRKGAGRSERASDYAADYITISTAELLARGVKRPNGAGEARQWELPPHLPAQYPAQLIKIPPYLLGASIGDGNFSNRSLVLGGSAAKIALWERHLLAEGISYRIAQLHSGDDSWALSIHGQMPALRRLGLAGLLGHDKHLPLAYRENTPAVRLAVLQGLMDADGTCDARGIAVYTSESRQLALDVAWLVRSLGGKAFVGDAQPSHYRRIGGDRVRTQDHYDVTVRMPSGLPLFTLPQKAARMRPCQPRYLARWIDSIEPDGEEEAMCVQVDARDGLYLARDFIVTHNTTFLSWVLMWHGSTRFPQKSVCTAPSADQLYDALWAELLMWLRRMPLAWQQLFHATGDRVELRVRPDESFITARTSRQEQPEALQGVHSAFVLLIGDEASGIPEAVFEAASGSMSTPGAITILTGNPTRSTGFFHKTQTADADRWWTRRVSSEDSKRVSRQFIEEMAQRYGRNSNAFRVRVLGEFPSSQGDTLIGAEIVEQAMERVAPPDMAEDEIWGVDAARFGVDHSVLIKRRGFVVPEPPRHWVGLDTMQLAGVIVNEWNRITYEPHRPRAIVVDAIGIGAGVEDRLREQGLPVVGVNVAETPSVEGRFRRQRDELWQACADWFATRKPSLPWHERLRDDLVGPSYTFTSDGRLIVESKAEMRSRGLPSPDYADSLCLTFSPGAQIAAAMRDIRWNRPIRRGIKGMV